jgi:ribonuclease R
MVQLLRVDPLRGQADFSITEKLSAEPKKRRTREDTERDARNYKERADRAAAAEALGLVSQPDEDDYESDVPEYASVGSHKNRGGREGRRDRFNADAPSFERTGRGDRRGGRDDRRGSRNSRNDEGFFVASEPREARRGRRSSEKGRGRSSRGGRRGR